MSFAKYEKYWATCNIGTWSLSSATLVHFVTLTMIMSWQYQKFNSFKALMVNESNDEFNIIKDVQAVGNIRVKKLQSYQNLWNHV